jgi:hypothetical protein
MKYTVAFWHWVERIKLQTEHESFKKRKSENNFLSNASLFQKEHWFLEVSQASPVRASGNNNVYMEMTVKHYWNGSDRGKRSTPRITCPGATFFTINKLIWIWIKTFLSYRTVNSLRLGYKYQPVSGTQ